MRTPGVPRQNSGAGSDCAIVDDYRVCRGEMPRGRHSAQRERRNHAAKRERVERVRHGCHLAVDTGTWLPGRRVLISPISLGQPDWLAQRLPVALTKERVRNSPDIDTQKPVSRQHEADYLGYYGYPHYWGGMGMWGMGAYPGYLMSASAVPVDMTARSAETKASQAAGDSHLRSCKAVTGHHIEATDGEIGHVADFLLDDDTWAIRYLVVDTSNWWVGHKVLVAPRWSRSVSWLEGKVFVDVTRQAVRDAPLYDPIAHLDRQQEVGIHQHDGRPGHWTTDAR